MLGARQQLICEAMWTALNHKVSHAEVTLTRQHTPTSSCLFPSLTLLSRDLCDRLLAVGPEDTSAALAERAQDPHDSDWGRFVPPVDSAAACPTLAPAAADETPDAAAVTETVGALGETTCPSPWRFEVFPDDTVPARRRDDKELLDIVTKPVRGAVSDKRSRHDYMTVVSTVCKVAATQRRECECG